MSASEVLSILDADSDDDTELVFLDLDVPAQRNDRIQTRKFCHCSASISLRDHSSVLNGRSSVSHILLRSEDDCSASALVMGSVLPITKRLWMLGNNPHHKNHVLKGDCVERLLLLCFFAATEIAIFSVHFLTI